MTNTNMLKSKIVLFGDTQNALAEHLGISRQSLSAKINGEKSFTQPEIKKIIVRYQLNENETDLIFFND